MPFFEILVIGWLSFMTCTFKGKTLQPLFSLPSLLASQIQLTPLYFQKRYTYSLNAA